MVGAYLYEIGMRMLLPLMKVAAIWNRKIEKGVAGRIDIWSDLIEQFSKPDAPQKVAWFHAASLGEFEQGRPVIEIFKAQYPDYFILLTFFSPSGYEVRKNYGGADYICYLPIDTASNAQKFVELVKPKITFFIKYEFWYHYLKELRKSGSYIISFSTIFRQNQIFFKPYGGFYRKLLTYFDYLMVQNEESLHLLKNIGISNCSIAGDTRFDRVQAIALAAQKLPIIEQFKGESFCLVGGSVWPEDMDALIPALNGLDKPIKAIIAPHEINVAEIVKWQKVLKGKSVLYSEYILMQNPPAFDYLFIDNVGMLSSLYRYGNVALVGGAFRSGLHNVLEAATFGMPIMFGDKKYEKFQEAVDLIQTGGAYVVHTHADIQKLLALYLSDPEKCKQDGMIASKYVQERVGATADVMSIVRSMIA
jgi:3-deoxy-D-manno-octulosonic-acid transferase